MTLFTLASFACGDDSKDEAGDADTSGTAETADSTTAPETSGSSMEGDGDGDPETGDGDGDPETGDGDGDPETGDGDGDPETGDGDGDGEPGDGDGDPNSPCPDYESQDDCEADPACMPLMGQPLQENGPDAPCLQPSEYAGCVAMAGCGDALTWFCSGGGGKPVLMSSTCGPEGAEMCDPMIADPPECP
jgi:hypothetical protein